MEDMRNISSIGKKRKLSPLAIVLMLSGGFFVVFVVVSALLFMNRPNDEWESLESGMLDKPFTSANGIGVLEISGVIMDSKRVLKQLKKFAKSDRVKAVVLRLDSPGGAVAPSQEIYEAVKKFEKPIISSMGSVAASGAYYIAVGSEKIFANSGTVTGSIGVLIELANLKNLYEWAKIQRYSITSGPLKDATAEYKDLSPDARKLLQGLVDDMQIQFKEAVSKGRNLPLDKVDRLADGRIFTGTQAKNVGLVDEIGTLEDAIAAVAKMANIEGEPRVIYPEKKRARFLDLLLDGDEEEFGGSMLERWAYRFLGGRGHNELDQFLQYKGAKAIDTRGLGVYLLLNGFNR